MKIELAVLRTALETSLAHVETLRGGTIEVPDDLYWFVPADQLHDPTREPTALTLGSLADDWAEVAAVADGRKDPIGYVLVWASAVLRAVGDRTP